MTAHLTTTLSQYAATFYEGLLLAQRADLAPQPSILLLQRLARHARHGRLVLQARPDPQLIRPHIQFAVNLGCRCPGRPTVRLQPHRFGLDLCRESTTHTSRVLRVRSHVPPPPLTDGE